jgi:hypothetical protein
MEEIMDPNVCLKELLEAIEKLRDVEGMYDHDIVVALPSIRDLIESTCDSVQALDKWLQRGGFLPTRWEK